MVETGPPRPVIAVAGLPRVGSMWSFNVARQIVRTAGLSLVPESIPRYDAEMFDAAATYLKSPALDCYCIIKVHEAVKQDSAIKIIRNQRNPADRLFSVLRFFQTPFSEEFVREFAEHERKVEGYYDRWPDDRILNIDYEDLGNDSRGLVVKIADFIGLSDLSRKTISEIDEAFSRSNVRNIVSKLDESADKAEGAKGRLFDKHTGFQTTHVSSYRAGDWRKLWSDAEVEIVERILLP